MRVLNLVAPGRINLQYIRGRFRHRTGKEGKTLNSKGMRFGTWLGCILILAAVGCRAPEPRKVPVYSSWPFDSAEAKHRQLETAQALGIPVEKTIDLGSGVKLELVLIPAGEFMMGWNEPIDEVIKKCHERIPLPPEKVAAWRERELPNLQRSYPQHRVRITNPFYMGKYEITQEQWTTLTGNTIKEHGNGGLGVYEGPRLPMYYVSWSESRKFLKKLTELQPGAGTFSLSTEAEWEYACRAGTATPFCFGNTINGKQASFVPTTSYGQEPDPEGDVSLRPVGSFSPNAFGLYDMHGNIAEWCLDWYMPDYYKDSPADDPRGPSNSSFEAPLGHGIQARVVRGGAYLGFAAWDISSASRSYSEDLRCSLIGFRVVLRIPQAESSHSGVTSK